MRAGRLEGARRPEELHGQTVGAGRHALGGERWRADLTLLRRQLPELLGEGSVPLLVVARLTALLAAELLEVRRRRCADEQLASAQLLVRGPRGEQDVAAPVYQSSPLGRRRGDGNRAHTNTATQIGHVRGEPSREPHVHPGSEDDVARPRGDEVMEWRGRGMMEGSGRPGEPETRARSPLRTREGRADPSGTSCSCSSRARGRSAGSL